MSSKKQEQSRTDVITEETVEAISKTEQYLKDNRKKIIATLIVVIVVFAGILAYRNLYSMPRQEKANEAIFKAEASFAKEAYDLALNGDGAGQLGFLAVIDKYKGTDAANLAEAYAGICYAQLGEPEKAISYLEKFKAKDIMVAPAIRGAIGDCYVELDNFSEAVKHFERAAKDADNDLLSPIFLKKAGLAYEAMSDKENARKCYQTIVDKYYNSAEYGEAEKLLLELDL